MGDIRLKSHDQVVYPSPKDVGKSATFPFILKNLAEHPPNVVGGEQGGSNLVKYLSD